MTEMERRDFMGNALKTVFAGLISSGADSSLAQETNQSGNNSVGTSIPDLVYHHDDNGIYLKRVDEGSDRPEKSIILDSEDLERLDSEHPFRIISNLDIDTKDVYRHILNGSSENDDDFLRRYRSEVTGIMDDLETSAAGFDEAWKMLKEDAQAASTEFDYIDSRQHREGRSYVEVPEADIPNSIGSEINSGVYFGESFDAWMIQENRSNSGSYDNSVLLAFEKGMKPEDVLSEEEYFESSQLSGDQEALSKIYESSGKSKEDYEFNFQS